MILLAAVYRDWIVSILVIVILFLSVLMCGVVVCWWWIIKPCGSFKRGVCPGWGRQCADHLLFCSMVEHLAPRGFSEYGDWFENGGDHADGHAHYDDRVLDVQYRGDPRSGPLCHGRAGISADMG